MRGTYPHDSNRYRESHHKPTLCRAESPFPVYNEGITNEVVEGRRNSSYFVPIARPKKKDSDQQRLFDTEWTQDRIFRRKVDSDYAPKLTLFS